MKTTNTNTNINSYNNNSIAQETLKQVILAAAKKSKPSAKQIAKDQRECDEHEKIYGYKIKTLYPLWDWYQKLMDNLEISEEFHAGHGNSGIDIVESMFRLAELDDNCRFCSIYNHEEHYNECIKLITNAGLKAEFDNWRAQRQVYDCNGQPVRVEDIIRFPHITEVCGKPVENGFEARVNMTKTGLVWIAYPENAWFGSNGEEAAHLHLPGVPLTAELAKTAEVIIRREEGFVRHPDHGDFMFPRIHEPSSKEHQIFVKKS